MLDLRQRSTEPELLDLGAPEHEVRQSLADIRFVNTWLGGRRALLEAVGRLLAKRAGPARLLDVGCGSGDLPGALQQRFEALVPICLDIQRLHLREAPGGLCRVQADVLHLPFQESSVDIVTASLFLHHFDGDEVQRVLRQLYAVSRRGVIVNDLRRAYVPYAFGRLFFPFLMRSRISVLDGLTSIRRSFTPNELRTAFHDADLPDPTILKRFPYRLIAVVTKT
jgi:ubiquinone/menaquinone biosynthesis C-methylase UbiE